MLKITIAAACLLATHAQAQQFLMMPDSTNNRVVLFSPTDGSLVNSNYFALAGGTPIHAMQVGNEIWVSEQIGDRISRWALNGTAIGAVTGGMDNVRGMPRLAALSTSATPAPRTARRAPTPSSCSIPAGTTSATS